MKFKIERDNEVCFERECNGVIVTTITNNETYGAVVGEMDYLEVLGLIKTLLNIVEDLTTEYPEIPRDILKTKLEVRDYEDQN